MEHPRIIAYGEMGLDYKKMMSEKEDQKSVQRANPYSIAVRQTDGDSR